MANATVEATDLQHLEEQLAEFSSPSDEVLQLLESFCSHCTIVIFNDFRNALDARVEDHLWTAHLRVNVYYRTALRKLDHGGNAKAVEHRKCAALYLRFLKSSQRFYRGFIKALNAEFGGIGPLEKLASKFSNDQPLSKPLPQANRHSTSRVQILHSGFRSLIQLGDLSRYRETELAKEKPEWAPAIGYYDLARFLIPSSGISYNQLAIIALSDDNLFRAIYWLFRALFAETPHPQADQNLRRAFSKVRANRESDNARTSVSRLKASFLQILHRAQSGKMAPEIHDLEAPFTEGLGHELWKTQSDGWIRKLYLINFAAVHQAQEIFTKTQGADGTFDAFILTLKLALRSCCVLLGTVVKQLEDFARVWLSDPLFARHLEGAIAITLPSWRLSMAWISKNKLLLTHVIHSEIDPLQSELWMKVARCLSAAGKILHRRDVPPVDYLLNEDEDTVGFTPLICDSTQHIWSRHDGQIKQTRGDVEIAFERSTEMIHRLATCLDMGKSLALDAVTPLHYDDKGVYYLGDASDRATEQILADDVCEDAADLEAERMVDELVDEHDGSFARSPGLAPAAATTDFAAPEVHTSTPSSCIVGSSTTELMSTAARRISLEQRTDFSQQKGPSGKSYRRDSASPQTRTIRQAQSPNLRVTSHPHSIHTRTLSHESNASIASSTGHRRSALEPVDTAVSNDDHGLGSVLLFGAGNSPWSMTSPESKRLSDQASRGGSPMVAPRRNPTPIDGSRMERTMSEGNRKGMNVHAKPFK